jgi:cell division topological specificity factor
VFDFLKSLFKPAPSSGETAKERLRLVLLSDHLSLAPDVVESLKRDLLDVISRYVEIDLEHADVTFEQREREVAMLANIPITAVRDRQRPSPELPFTPEPSPEPRLAAEPVVAAEPAVVAEQPGVAAEAPSPSTEAPAEVQPRETPETPQAPELEFAGTAAPKPKRSGNAAGTRRRRRKKYAAAAAKANHAQPQQLGNQASAQG